MSILKTILATAAVAFGLTATAQNRSIAFAEGKWSDILAKAKQEKKTIYLDCYTSWCGPCKWMAKNVFTNDTVADFYNSHFIPGEFDMEKGEGKELAAKYGIQAYPTMLYLDAEGNVLHRTCGSTPAAEFIENGKDALDPGKQLAGYTKTFNNGKVEGNYAYHYFSMLQNGCQSYDNELKSYFSAQLPGEMTSRINWNILYAYLDDYTSPAFSFLEKNSAAYSKLYTADSVQSKINTVYSAGLILAIRKKDNAGYQQLKEKIRASGNPDAEKIILLADLKQYQVNADWNSYAAAALNYAGKYGQNDPQLLNTFAWNFYENIGDKAMLAEAEKWAKRAVELKHEYAFADTYAAVLYKLGKKQEAKAAAGDAIALAKESGEDYKGTAELLEKINKMK